GGIGRRGVHRAGAGWYGNGATRIATRGGRVVGMGRVSFRCRRSMGLRLDELARVGELLLDLELGGRWHVVDEARESYPQAVGIEAERFAEVRERVRPLTVVGADPRGRLVEEHAAADVRRPARGHHDVDRVA